VGRLLARVRTSKALVLSFRVRVRASRDSEAMSAARLSVSLTSCRAQHGQRDWREPQNRKIDRHDQQQMVSNKQLQTP
jgi:hypothetical protein